MNEIDHLKKIVLYSGDVNHLHIKKNSLNEFLLYSYR
jgi:hypothetical protein